MTPIGQMKYLVTVMKTTYGAVNELGETTPSTNSVTQVWAKITPISGTEKFVNAQNTADVTHEIRCRYSQYIDHTCTLQYDGTTFDIVSVLDLDLQHVEMQILAHAVVN